MPKTAKPPTRGADLESRLAEAILAVRAAPHPDARALPQLSGVGHRGGFAAPQENVLQEATTLLVDSGRVFSYGDNIVVEVRDQDVPRLVELRTGDAVAPGAEYWLANLFICAGESGEFPPPRSFVELLLRSEPLAARLPRIGHYARRPTVDDHYTVLGPGWHPESGILVHCRDVEPVEISDPDPSAPAIERLPPRLRHLLGGFCFAEAADVANAVGMLVTGVLVNHFVEVGKPIALIDGNQPGTGKTLLARATNLVLSGAEVTAVAYTSNEDELRKQIGAVIRDPRQSVVLIDNGKRDVTATVSSPTIESCSMMPVVSIRILKESRVTDRPNDLLWMLTMNGTRVSTDIASRAIPIRLHYDGPPEERQFGGDEPVEFARLHRDEILAELLGMVLRWVQHGCPPGHRNHRCVRWARIVGGILEVCGFPEFLANAGAAATAFNSDLEDLSALAEHVVSKNEAGFVTEVEPPPATVGRKAADWVPVLRQAGVRREALDGARSPKAAATLVGSLLAALVGRPVPVDIEGQPGRATLRFRPGRSNTRLYHFHVAREGQLVEAEAAPPAASELAVAVEPLSVAVVEPLVVAIAGGNGEAW